MTLERGFPKVRVISLHSADCKQAAKGRRYVRCRCPKALYWFQDGRDHVEVAGTDEYEEAKQYARDKEIALICRALSSWYAKGTKRSCHTGKSKRPSCPSGPAKAPAVLSARRNGRVWQRT